jgi:hypothetical protein
MPGNQQPGIGRTMRSGLGGSPFCKPFSKWFLSEYWTLEAGLLISFGANAVGLQQPLPTPC